jgi:hypothetical protein
MELVLQLNPNCNLASKLSPSAASTTLHPKRDLLDVKLSVRV